MSEHRDADGGRCCSPERTGKSGSDPQPGADREAMKQSLARLSALPGETHLYPGHMSETTIERECQDNPYFT